MTCPEIGTLNLNPRLAPDLCVSCDTNPHARVTNHCPHWASTDLGGNRVVSERPMVTHVNGWEVTSLYGGGSGFNGGGVIGWWEGFQVL
jgi:hypothetical protein